MKINYKNNKKIHNLKLIINQTYIILEIIL